jgi:hypothetical protein
VRIHCVQDQFSATNEIKIQCGAEPDEAFEDDEDNDPTI